MNKYFNNNTLCFSGHNHESGAEAFYCNKLLGMQQKEEIAYFDIQVPFVFMINGKKICTHYVDFLVHYIEKDKPSEVHEVKGMATDVWRIKHKLFKAIYPNIPYKIISERRRNKCQTKVTDPILRRIKVYR